MGAGAMALVYWPSALASAASLAEMPLTADCSTSALKAAALRLGAIGTSYIRVKCCVWSRVQQGVLEEHELHPGIDERRGEPRRVERNPKW